MKIQIYFSRLHWKGYWKFCSWKFNSFPYHFIIGFCCERFTRKMFARKNIVKMHHSHDHATSLSEKLFQKISRTQVPAEHCSETLLDNISTMQQHDSSFDMKDYVVDIIGFRRLSGTFIVKEISFLGIQKSAQPSVHLMKSPIPWEALTREEKCLSQWLEEKFHGIGWSFGDVPYHKLRRVFEICLSDARNVYVKNDEEKLWIQQLVPKLNIISMEDIGFISLERIDSKEKYVCFNHDHCWRKPACAALNALTLRTWIRDYFERKFIRDEADSK